MADIEQLVRPFESPKVINDKKTRVTSVKTIGTDKAIIRWGSAGASPETRQVGVKITLKGADVKKAFTQVSRKDSTIRVTNPTDSSQFVDVARATEVKFRRPKPFVDKRTGQPSNLEPGNQGPDIVSPTVTSSPGFSDGSVGTTIVKPDSSFAVSGIINGNINAIGTPSEGVNLSTASGRTETSTFVFNYDDVGVA